MNGIVIGYLNSSPFDALTLAIMMQITFNMIRNMTIGIPTIMIHNGIERTRYKSIDNSKLRDDLPLRSTQRDSSFLVNQQIRGPIMLPKGKKNPAKAER